MLSLTSPSRTLLIFTIVRCGALAYNIDSHNAKVFNDPANLSNSRRSYFGFSVALYASVNGSRLLVGAPRANSSGLSSVREPGTVFACAINGARCEEWPIDKTGNGFHRHYRKAINQIKDNAWIGATIAVENKTKPGVVVCGPRWINNNVQDDWRMNGICYGTLATDPQAFSKKAERQFIPFADPTYQTTMANKIAIYDQGMGQAGFSLNVNSHGNDLHIVLGAPGVYSWKGNAVLITGNDLSSNMVIPAIAKEERIFSYNYFGYAVTSGAYFNRQNVWYASSAPRNSKEVGRIFVFTFPNKSNQYMSVKTIVYGRQYGEYFGGALTSCDVNNDHRHELIVGAPLWSKNGDEGRVYIFTVRHDDNFEELRTIEGEMAGGRFGSAVVCLGDIDYDGYGDIAVGAPYEAENGGAVYIFNGNRDGVSRRHSQRLVGSSYSRNIRGFGISISEARDVDGDNHPDFAVGAYLSDKVVLLKSVPVITVNLTLAYLGKMKLLRNATFFVIDMSVSYEGAYVPANLPIVKTLRIDPLHGRAVFRDRMGDHKIYRMPDKLRESVVSHVPFMIYLTSNIQNVIDPIEMIAAVHVEEDLYARNEDPAGDKFCTSCVVVNKFSSRTEHLIEVPFTVECGEDNECVSDLAVTLSTDKGPGSGKYIIGSTPTIILRVHVRNQGEPAYQTRVRISSEILSLANILPECREESHEGIKLDVTCDIGNPLRTNKTLTMQLDISAVRHDVKEIKLRASVSTQSNEANLLDNDYVMTINFDVDVDIAIAGKTEENLYSFLAGDDKSLSNVRFQHIYEIQKFGASPIEEAALTVKIPTHWQHGSDSIAVVSINSTIGKINGYEFYCSDLTEVKASSDVKVVQSEEVNIVDANRVHYKSNNTYVEKDTPIMHVPSENRTLYINCTSTAVQCVQLDCKLGPFVNSLSVARLVITLDLHLAKLDSDVLENKDIIYIVSEGNVRITQPYNISQRDGHKPDVALVATVLSSPIAYQVASWVIALSVLLGIALLTLLTLGLIKIGFFNRKKKTELEALKAKTDKQYNIVLETMSSNEVLDHE